MCRVGGATRTRKTERESLDTATPAGRMVFTVLGGVSELERSLIVERVKAGLRNARAKGKRLGRPKKILDTKRITTLRAKGIGWKRIAAEMRVLGSELSIASPWRVPKFAKRFSEPSSGIVKTFQPRRVASDCALVRFSFQFPPNRPTGGFTE